MKVKGNAGVQPRSSLSSRVVHVVRHDRLLFVERKNEWTHFHI